jgi:RNA polymerase sigma factor (sigma-70 family)
MIWREMGMHVGGDIDPERELEMRLVAQARDGAAWAMSALVARYQPPVVRYLVRLTGYPEQAYVLSEQVFVQMGKRLRSLSGEESVRLWLLRTATELGLNALRYASHARPARLAPPVRPAALPPARDPGRDRHSTETRSRHPHPSTERWRDESSAHASEWVTIEEEESGEETLRDVAGDVADSLSVEEAVRHRLVRAVLAELPYGDAQCLALHLVAGLNQNQVATALGVEPRVVRRRIVQGLQLFGNRFEAAYTSLGMPGEEQRLTLEPGSEDEIESVEGQPVAAIAADDAEYPADLAGVLIAGPDIEMPAFEPDALAESPATEYDAEVDVLAVDADTPQPIDAMEPAVAREAASSEADADIVAPEPAVWIEDTASESEAPWASVLATEPADVVDATPVDALSEPEATTDVIPESEPGEMPALAQAAGTSVPVDAAEAASEVVALPPRIVPVVEAPHIPSKVVPVLTPAALNVAVAPEPVAEDAKPLKIVPVVPASVPDVLVVPVLSAHTVPTDGGARDPQAMSPDVSAAETGAVDQLLAYSARGRETPDESDELVVVVEADPSEQETVVTPVQRERLWRVLSSDGEAEEPGDGDGYWTIRQ